MCSTHAWVAALVAAAMAMVLPPAAHGSVYEDMLMEDFMKRLAAYEDPYGMVAPDYYDDNSIPLESRDNGQTNIRDQEYLEHSASHQGGFQYIQGNFVLLQKESFLVKRLLQLNPIQTNDTPPPGDVRHPKMSKLCSFMNNFMFLQKIKRFMVWKQLFHMKPIVCLMMTCRVFSFHFHKHKCGPRIMTDLGNMLHPKMSNS